MYYRGIIGKCCQKIGLLAKMPYYYRNMAINTETLLLPPPSAYQSKSTSVRTEVFQQRLKDQQKEQLEQAATRSQPLARALAANDEPDILFQNERYSPTNGSGGLIASLPSPWRGALVDVLI